MIDHSLSLKCLYRIEIEKPDDCRSFFFSTEKSIFREKDYKEIYILDRQYVHKKKNVHGQQHQLREASTTKSCNKCLASELWFIIDPIGKDNMQIKGELCNML